MATPTAFSSTNAGDANARFHAALGLMKDQQFDDAEIALTTLTRDNPLLSGPWTDLGILQARAKRWPEARVSFQKATAANPANVVALNWLGTVSRNLGDYARAEQAYLQAIQAQPGYAPTRLNLAVLYDVSMRRQADALAQYRSYQQYAQAGKPIVQAWIRELETLGTSIATPSILAARIAP